MKTSKQRSILFSVLIVLFFINCTKKEADNPFDADCPKELFTPANFKSELSGTSVKLSWTQENLIINGFVINRSENSGGATEVVRIDKATTSWTDTKVIGGAKYDYTLYAYAGANLSNPLSSSITAPTLGATVTTSSAATAITPNSATLGGNVSADGGSPVTERGICYGTSQNPTIANSKLALGNGTGLFSGAITGLAVNTTYYAKAYATNSYGTTYGAEVSFTTSPMLAPTVTTSTATSITAISAVLGGNVTSDGNATISENGICYSLTENPTTANSKVAIANGTGAFSKIVTGLTEGTTYFVRAYAINSIGTAYGSQISFPTTQLLLPTISTADATNVTGSTAILGGNVTNDGNATVTERGICFSTNQNPTTANTKLIIGNGTGTFNNTISGLSANTTYYAKAYAINSKGTSYGDQISFKTGLTLSLASLTTSTPASVTNNSALLGGNITDDGNATVTERGICYNTSGLPTIGSAKVVIGNGTGSFSNTITGFSPNTTYYVRAYATNSVGTAYGSQLSFVSLGSIPTVSTKDATNILETSAIVGGIALTDEGSAVTDRGVCYGTTTSPSIYDSKIASGSGLGGFNIPLNTLVPNTTYYVRAYATNKNGTAYGENKTFKTADAYYAGFENGLPTGWSGSWTIANSNSFEGFYCLQSAHLNETISFTKTFVNSGQISFYYYGSPKSWGGKRSEFFIDDIKVGTLLEGQGWTQYAFPVTSGNHTFKWVTITDNSSNMYNAYVDYIVCPK